MSEKRQRNTKHIEVVKQLDPGFYCEGRPYRIFLNNHPRANEFNGPNGCYVLCTSACTGSVTFVKAVNTIVHEEIMTKVISLNIEEIDKYDITIMRCIDDNELLKIIDMVKADPDNWYGMKNYEYVPGIDMPAEMDPVPDNYVYVKGDNKTRLFERNEFDDYEFKLHRLQDLCQGLYALIFEKNDGTKVIEVDCDLEVHLHHIDVQCGRGNCHSAYILGIDQLILTYKSLKIMSMKEYHEIMTEENTKEEE